MTITLWQATLYAGGIFLLFITPGPVWVALVARAVSGGFASAWPLAFGVVLGDAFWPILAILGVSWIVSVYADFLLLLRWAAVVIFLVMGWSLIRHANARLGRDDRLTAPGKWAGFTAGVLIILSNPKAILFYMGVLPGFFDLSSVTVPDIIVISAISMVVPLLGNLCLALFVDRVRLLIGSDTARAKLNKASGVALILVGIAIGLSAV